LGAGAWTYDEWVRNCMAHAVGSLYRGLYDLAKVEALNAVTPVAQRSTRYKIPYSPPVSVEQLRRAFRVIAASPVREHPVFL
jgi:hypothetical protein